MDFESTASTIPPFPHVYVIPIVLSNTKNIPFNIKIAKIRGHRITNPIHVETESTSVIMLARDKTNDIKHPIPYKKNIIIHT